MQAFTLVALFVGLLQANDKMVNDRIETLCKSGSFDEVLKIEPKGVKYSSLKHCLRNRDNNKDAQLATIIGRFPEALPQGHKLKKVSKALYEYNMLKSLRALLGNGRCFQLDKKLRKFFAQDKDLNVKDLCKKGMNKAIIPGGSGPKHTPEPAHGSVPSSTSITAPTTVGSPIHGSLKYWNEQQVHQTPDLLSRITVEQATELGQANNACLGMTSAHFQAVGVNAAVVASLSVHCFRRIPAEAFSGLSVNMVGTITAWPFVRRSQVRAIRPEAIVALPFDQLGIGKQNKDNLKKHACFGITNAQLKAIKKNSKASKAYNGRCIKSRAAGVLVPNSALLGVCLSVALLFVV